MYASCVNCDRFNDLKKKNMWCVVLTKFKYNLNDSSQKRSFFLHKTTQLILYLDNWSKFSERFTPGCASSPLYSVRWVFLNVGFMICSSKICPVCSSIKFPVVFWMLNPRKVTVWWSGLKNKYGCGLKLKWMILTDECVDILCKILIRYKVKSKGYLIDIQSHKSKINCQHLGKKRWIDEQHDIKHKIIPKAN